LNTLKYLLEEIINKHHSMFCPSDFVQSTKYKEFWANLANGEFQSGQFLRLNKFGEKIFIQTSYVPVFDLTGKVSKIVKYATDITAQKDDQIEILGVLTKTAKQLTYSANDLTFTAT
jgi:methyl-accepting chemotaxis protein